MKPHRRLKKRRQKKVVKYLLGEYERQTGRPLEWMECGPLEPFRIHHEFAPRLRIPNSLFLADMTP